MRHQKWRWISRWPSRWWRGCHCRIRRRRRLYVGCLVEAFRRSEVYRHERCASTHACRRDWSADVLLALLLHHVARIYPHPPFAYYLASVHWARIVHRPPVTHARLWRPSSNPVARHVGEGILVGSLGTYEPTSGNDHRKGDQSFFKSDGRTAVPSRYRL